MRSLLAESPLGALVRWVARIQTSVHTKLLCAFLLIAFLIIGVGAISLQILAAMGRHIRSLDEAHERVHWSQQIQHALALQMHYTAMALVRQDEGAVAQILRENNRFNDTLARIEGAAPPDERTLIQQIRTAQDEAMAVVADIANSIRAGEIDDAMHALTTREEPLYRTIDGLVQQVVAAEEARMASLRAGAIDRRPALPLPDRGLRDPGDRPRAALRLRHLLVVHPPRPEGRRVPRRGGGGEFRRHRENPQPR